MHAEQLLTRINGVESTLSGVMYKWYIGIEQRTQRAHQTVSCPPAC